MAYDVQLRHKTEMVREAVARIGGLSRVKIGDTWGMEEPWHYRNRAEYHADLDASGRLVLGFLKHHSHDVVPADRCQVQHPLAERIREVTAGLVNRVAQSPEERSQLYRVEVFVSFAQQQALVTFVGQGRPGFVPLVGEELRQQVPQVAGVLLSRARGRTLPHRSPAQVVLGKSRLTEKLGDYEYLVSADSFFQVNPSQATRMLSLVQEWACPRPPGLRH